MRTSARVKWRFRRSVAVVSLRDDSEFRDFVGFQSHASARDAIPSALRLPRRCAPRNDTKMVGFAIKPTIFISEMFEIRLAGAPCFAKECHTFGFKIATAALRPRNDTNLKRFCFGNGRFCFMRPFCAERLRTVFQAFRSENRYVFQQTLSELSLRGGHFQCPTRQSLTERDGIPERGTEKLRGEIHPLAECGCAVKYDL